jgi:hypothetical protein
VSWIENEPLPLRGAEPTIQVKIRAEGVCGVGDAKPRPSRLMDCQRERLESYAAIVERDFGRPHLSRGDLIRRAILLAGIGQVQAWLRWAEEVRDLLEDV